MQKALPQDVAYEMEMGFYFAEIENKGWFETYKKGDKKGQRKAATRWKRIDTTNLVKLAEDAVKSATGVDDCATFDHWLKKRKDASNPRVDIVFYRTEVDREVSG